MPLKSCTLVCIHFCYNFWHFLSFPPLLMVSSFPSVIHHQHACTKVHIHVTTAQTVLIGGDSKPPLAMSNQKLALRSLDCTCSTCSTHEITYDVKCATGAHGFGEIALWVKLGPGPSLISRALSSPHPPIGGPLDHAYPLCATPRTSHPTMDPCLK